MNVNFLMVFDWKGQLIQSTLLGVSPNEKGENWTFILYWLIFCLLYLLQLTKWKVRIRNHEKLQYLLPIYDSKALNFTWCDVNMPPKSEEVADPLCLYHRILKISTAKGLQHKRDTCNRVAGDGCSWLDNWCARLGMHMLSLSQLRDTFQVSTQNV